MEKYEVQEVVDALAERRQRLLEQLEELRTAIKLIEKHARRVEREIERHDSLMKRVQAGMVAVGVERRPAFSRFANMSIPDAAAEVIQVLERSLHVRELLEALETGGKRFHAARPTVSIAAALSRDARFVRVKPNTFDLVERTQPRLPIEE